MGTGQGAEGRNAPSTIEPLPTPLPIGDRGSECSRNAFAHDDPSSLAHLILLPPPPPPSLQGHWHERHAVDNRCLYQPVGKPGERGWVVRGPAVWICHTGLLSTPEVQPGVCVTGSDGPASSRAPQPTPFLPRCPPPYTQECDPLLPAGWPSQFPSYTDCLPCLPPSHAHRCVVRCRLACPSPTTVTTNPAAACWGAKLWQSVVP